MKAASVPVGLARKRRGAWTTIRRVTAILVVQALLFMTVLEVVGRLADPLGISYYPETASYLDTLIVGGPIGYRNAPNLRGRFWNVDVSINALGMRDRDVELEPAAGEQRVLVLGDSWPFGVGVAYEDSIPFLLEERLNEAYRGRTHFRSLNFGVPSYNSEQQLIQYKELGLALQPRLTLLMFASNDIEPKRWVLDKRKDWYVDLAQRSYAACLLVVLGRRVRGALGVRSQLIQTSAYQPLNPRWKAIEDSLTEISTLSRDREIPFVVVSHLGDDDPALGLLTGLGERAGFPVVNLRPHEDPRWASVPPRALENSASDSHPNPQGTRVEVTLIYEALERMGTLETIKR